MFIQNDDNMIQIDEIDDRLISLLAENARAPVVTLARQLGLARTTVQARIDRLERNGSIRGYTVTLGDHARPRIQATALVSIEPRAGPAVLQRLKTLPAVQTVFTCSGRVDLIVTIGADTTSELDETLDKIGEAKGVRSSESLIHLSVKVSRSRS